MDDVDRKILTLLQADATLPVVELARRVGLSSTPCWRRVRNLETSGVIRRRVALLEPDLMNVGVTVFASLRTDRHDPAWLERFAEAVVKLPEVVEFYRMSGETDYLVRIVVPDIAAYDAVYKKLIAIAPLSDVSSSFAMECIKYTTALPIEYCA